MNKTIDKNIEEVVRGAYTVLASYNSTILKSVSEHHYFITGIAIGNEVGVLIDLTKKLNPYCTWKQYIDETEDSYKRLCCNNLKEYKC